jgi:hypothetical protein
MVSVPADLAAAFRATPIAEFAFCSVRFATGAPSCPHQRGTSGDSARNRATSFAAAEGSVATRPASPRGWPRPVPRRWRLSMVALAPRADALKTYLSLSKSWREDAYQGQRAHPRRRPHTVHERMRIHQHDLRRRAFALQLSRRRAPPLNPRWPTTLTPFAGSSSR